MSTPLRLLMSVGAFFGAWLLVFLVGLILVPEALAWMQPIVALGFGIWTGRRVWCTLGVDGDRNLPAYVGIGAAALGGLGLAVGFFGPMVLAPEANQGPLLGIFITGPGGAALGAFFGGFVWLKRRNDSSPLSYSSSSATQ